MAKKKTKPKKKGKAQALAPFLSREIKGFILLSFAFMLFLSLLSFSYGKQTANWLGLIGYTIGFSLHILLGLCSYLICLFIAWIGWKQLFSKPIEHLRIKVLFFSLFAFSFCILLSLAEELYPSLTVFTEHTLFVKWPHWFLPYHLGGFSAYYLYHDLPFLNLRNILNVTGVAVLFSTTMMASVLFFSEVTLAEVVARFRALAEWFKAKPEEAAVKAAEAGIAAKTAEPKKPVDFLRYVKLRIPQQSAQAQGSSDLLAIQPERQLTARPSVSRKEEIEKPLLIKTDDPLKRKIPLEAPDPLTISKPSLVNKREAALQAQQVHNGDYTHYQLPAAGLLGNPKKVDQTNLKKDLKRQAEVLEETLLSFGIEAKVGQINCGPTITSFEVHPAIGVKVQKIKTLENDIALNMEAKSIRIIAPIPGKAAVGIEVPNPQPQEVGFKELLTAYQQGGRKFHIPILLGKSVNGDYVMSDLAKMPHCIIAGATGSGKSVCINTIVMSIVYNAKPDEIQLLMVDPKKVELTPYSNLPHMIAPVITEPHGAYTALKWLVKEMESRYELLKILGLRNIESFNTRTPNLEFENSIKMPVPAKLPYMVGIIDELADLMMASSSDIETPIARIAQMARAVGIHLILATQRPSREVITGLIKANFPTRISFKVASRVNSQIILDEVGAEMLLGNGDMLFLPPGSSQLIRAQGAYIRDEEIHAAIKSVCEQAPPQYRIPSFDKMVSLDDPDGDNEGLGEETDALYKQAYEIVTGTGNASTTFLQRKLKIGYARAASLMDQLESRGVVSAAEGSKPRKVLIGKGESQDEAADLFDP